MASDAETTQETTQEQAPTAETAQESIVTSVQVRELSPSKVDLQVEVGSEHVDRAFKTVYRQLSQSGRVPGFRVGRVPRAVLRRYFTDEAIKEAALRELAPEAVTQAAQQAGLVALDVSPIRDVQISEGDVLRFTTTLEVRPKPRLGQYKGLQLVRPRAELTDEQVQRELEQMREAASAWVDTDRTEVRKGDRVFADVTVKVEGEEPMADTDVAFHVGEGRTQPPIDEGMVGAKVGTTIDIQTTYPDDFEDEQLAGKPAVATVTIKRIEEHREPQLDDEFAKENYGFDTLEALRADIRQRMESAAAEQHRTEMEEQALTLAVANAEIEIPKRLAQEQAELHLERLTADVGQYGMRYEDLLRASKASHEQMRARAERSSEERLKRYFVVQAIAEAEGIEVSDEEIDEEYARMAEEENRPVTAVREDLERRDDVDAVGLSVLHRKVRGLLVEWAVVTEQAAEEPEPAPVADEAGEEAEAPAQSEQETHGDADDAPRGDVAQ